MSLSFWFVMLASPFSFLLGATYGSLMARQNDRPQIKSDFDFRDEG